MCGDARTPEPVSIKVKSHAARVSQRVGFGTALPSAATFALDYGFGTWPRLWPSPKRGEHIASTSFLRPAHLTPCVANFLTLHGLWYSLDCGEIVRDQGTGDIQRMVTARETLGRNQGGPCHQMADSIQTWAAKVLAGDRRAIARAISTVEAGDTLGTELLKRLFPASGKAEVVGVTGSPGAGKSTLVEKLAGEYRRAGARVGIIAVDPTSPFSGGALLGDRIRMQSLSSDKEIYIRSMATRGQLGGLAPTTHDVVTILDAAGCDVVLIETVGVGQDEVEVARLADATALLLVPGMGDDVQTFKAGVMEIADLYVINKADRPGADRLEQEVQAMLSMASRADGWRPPIVKAIATTGSGVGEVRQALEQFRSFQEQGALKEKRRRSYLRSRFLELLRRDLFEKVINERLRDGSLEQFVDDLLQHRADPYSLVERIVAESVKQVSGVRGEGNSEF